MDNFILIKRFEDVAPDRQRSWQEPGICHYVMFVPFVFSDDALVSVLYESLQSHFDNPLACAIQLNSHVMYMVGEATLEPA